MSFHKGFLLPEDDIRSPEFLAKQIREKIPQCILMNQKIEIHCLDESEYTQTRKLLSTEELKHIYRWTYL